MIGFVRKGQRWLKLIGISSPSLIYGKIARFGPTMAFA
jgi:hypothetical protein